MSATVVIPCYNEADRLERAKVHEVAQRARVLLVDDGSTDDTLALLESIAAEDPERIGVLALDPNQGKAEAVRQGLLRAMDEDADWIGFADADMSTPPSELARLLDTARTRGLPVLLGSRVKLLGRDIDRKLARHYLGRVFATLASNVLRLPVYDTQCGAKFFQPTETLREALQEPFLSRWAFDVELIGRLLHPRDGVPAYHRSDFVEVPLVEWRDVAGSKLGVASMTRVLGDLARIELDLRRRR